MTAAVLSYIESLQKDPLRDDLRVIASCRVAGRFLGSEIASAFQPVARLDAAGPPVVTAAQALARVHADSGAELSPWNLFALAASDEQLVLLDRRCRIVHTLNFFAAAESATLSLLLNVHPRLLPAVASDHGRAFRRVLDSLAIEAQRVVIVLPPLVSNQLDLQCQVAASYRINGFRVAAAVDDPLLLQALFARQPVDVVRIESHRLASGPWRDGLSAALDAGAELHATRVEAEAGRTRALELGMTHWQGWWLARPAATPTTSLLDAGSQREGARTPA